MSVVKMRTKKEQSEDCFLIERNGEVIARFEPTTLPSAIAKDIEKLL